MRKKRLGFSSRKIQMLLAVIFHSMLFFLQRVTFNSQCSAFVIVLFRRFYRINSHSHKRYSRRLLSLAMKSFQPCVCFLMPFEFQRSDAVCVLMPLNQITFTTLKYKYSDTQTHTHTHTPTMIPFYRIQSIICTNPVNKSNSKSTNDNV